MINALTIDVEDYFQVSAFEGCVWRDEWDNYPLRVERNTFRILDMLDEFGVKATFFVLGWVAERCPELVRDIAKRGHEVASHGYGHQRVCIQSRKDFRADIRRSKKILEELAGEAVVGYRAPSYSISRSCLWAYDELLEAGYRYDSSVFPIHHDLYGIPDWPRHPFTVEKDWDGKWQPALPLSEQRTMNSVRGDPCFLTPVPCSLLPAPCTMTEIPITTLSIAGKRIPIAGGGYFRLFPYAFTHWGLRRINRVEGRPFVFYLHPWELDPGQPRVSGAGPKSRFRHYLNLHKTEGRFRNMLGDFRFAPVREVSWEPLTPYPRPHDDGKIRYSFPLNNADRVTGEGGQG
jgi:polysaccharide deacetylase family protein (PEP-CTERM system associated)